MSRNNNGHCVVLRNKNTYHDGEKRLKGETRPNEKVAHFSGVETAVALT